MPPASNSVRRAQPLLGTFVEITAAGAPQADMHEAIDAAFSAVARAHQCMSFHEADSDVGRLNGTAWSRPVRVHSWTFQVLETAVDLHKRSAGAFDVAVAPVLQDLGWLPRDQADQSSRSGEQATSAAIELLPDHQVRFRYPSIRIDLGGIAKGFAVDRAIDALRDCGMTCGLVNAGGDLAAFGSYAEVVHVRDPRDPSRPMLRIAVENQALASSGYRFDPFRSATPVGSAIIDPSTRAPARTIIAATVLAPSCMIADALTKAVIVAGPAVTSLLEYYRASALVVMADGSVEMTEDLRSAVCLAA